VGLVGRCGWGGGGPAVAGRNDKGGRCTVGLLGQGRCCRGVQVVLGVALPGHECIGVRLKKGSDNQHVLYGFCHGPHQKRRPSRQQKRRGGVHCKDGRCCAAVRRRLWRQRWQ